MASAWSIMVEVSCALIICMIAFAPNMIHVADADISGCMTVDSDLFNCFSFCTGNAAAPSPQCCNGVKALISQAKTTADRQEACSCLKSAAQLFGVKEANAKALPGLCNVNTNYTIDPNVDCSTIN
ncbi:hypothetical protein Droror1_Dr00009002 [Drosera rotundifolia]